MKPILLVEAITIDSLDVAMVRPRLDLQEALLQEKKSLHENIACLGVYTAPIYRLGKNKNNRYYDESTWSPALDAKLGEGSLGLMDHPTPNSPAGLGGSVKDIFCVWRNHRYGRYPHTNEKIVEADMYLLDNKWGKHVKSVLECGGKLDLSTRGYGTLTEDNKVRDYQFNSTDCVLVGSSNVRFGADATVPDDRLPENIKVKDNLKESSTPSETDVKKLQESKSTITETSTNNGVSLGEKIMNKVLIKRAITEAFNKGGNAAYFELESILKDIREDKDLADITKDVEVKMESLRVTLTEEKQGDAKDPGSVTSKDIYPGNKNVIKDTNEKKPNDVDPIDVDSDVKDTTPAERTSTETKYKAGGSKKAREYEVMSGNQMEQIEIEITPDTEVFEDEHGTYVVLESGEHAYIDANEAAAALQEDTDETEPEEVDEIEVDDISDTTDADRTDSDTKYKAASGGVKESEETPNLYRMSKAELIDHVLAVSEAANALQAQLEASQAETAELAESYSKVETWAMLGETVIEGDRTALAEAQNQVVEAVAKLQEKDAELQEANTALQEAAETIETLENHIQESQGKVKDSSDVQAWVSEMIVGNPQLAAWEKELRYAKNLTEARQAVAKYAGMGQRIRIDTKALTEGIQEVHVKSEGNAALTRKGWV